MKKHLLNAQRSKALRLEQFPQLSNAIQQAFGFCVDESIDLDSFMAEAVTRLLDACAKDTAVYNTIRDQFPFGSGDVIRTPRTLAEWIRLMPHPQDGKLRMRTEIEMDFDWLSIAVRVMGNQKASFDALVSFIINHEAVVQVLNDLANEDIKKFDGLWFTGLKGGAK
jgi:hypothetical protein